MREESSTEQQPPSSSTTMTKKGTIYLLLTSTLLNDSVNAAFNFRREPKKKKRAREGYKRTKDGWIRLDLTPDSMLRVGVTYRPRDCPAKSKSGDYLSVHYNGTLFSDGKDFDSSILREEPFVFQIGRQQMIEGWEKGLLDMCVGEKRKLVVPSDMAYGNIGGYGSEAINRINPGATLVYKVELLDILDEEAAAPYMVWGL